MIYANKSVAVQRQPSKATKTFERENCFTRFPRQRDVSVRHLGDERLVREWHWQTGNGVLLESLVEVAQRLAGLDFEAIVDEPSLAGSLACK